MKKFFRSVLIFVLALSLGMSSANVVYAYPSESTVSAPSLGGIGNGDNAHAFSNECSGMVFSCIMLQKDSDFSVENGDAWVRNKLHDYIINRDYGSPWSGNNVVSMICASNSLVNANVGVGNDFIANVVRVLYDGDTTTKSPTTRLERGGIKVNDGYLYNRLTDLPAGDWVSNECVDFVPVIMWSCCWFTQAFRGSWYYTLPCQCSGYEDTWFTPYSSFSDFARDMTKGGCLCLQRDAFCPRMLGPTHTHEGDSVGPTADWSGSSGKQSYMQTQYVEYPEGTYYGRGYISPYDGEPTTTPPGYTFHTTHTQNPANDAKCSNGQACTDTFKVWLSCDDTTRSIVSNTEGTYIIRVTETKYSDTTGVNNVTSSITETRTVNKSGMLQYLSEGISIDHTYGGMSLPTGQGQHWVKFNVTIKHPDGSVVTATPSCCLSGAHPDGNWCYDSTDVRYSTNHADWGPGSTEVHQVWGFKTTNNTPAYAEIVANAAFGDNVNQQASDWNVAQGIPSTENLAVAVGGESFIIQMSGGIHTLGSPAGDAVLIPQTAAVSGVIERTITFNVNITDIWGDDNPRCELSCPGHTNSISWTDSVTSPNGDVTESKTCPHCGETFSATGSWDIDVNSITGKITRKDPVPATTEHSCDITVTYDCSSGTATYGGSAMASGAVNSATLTYKQRYVGTATVKSKGGDECTSPSVRSDEMCDGYTTGFGCAHSNTECCASGHHGERTYTFTLKEYVDAYSYRDIVKARVYGLGKAEITSVDETLLDSSYVGQSTSNLNLTATIWRANDGYNGDTKNGRIYFTQFYNPIYSNGEGWSTAVSDTYYWLGNCTINLTAVCDSTLNGKSPHKDPNLLDDCTVSKTRGQHPDDGVLHWTVDSSHGTTTYQNNIGDWGTDADTEAQAKNLVNAWMRYNNGTGPENGYKYKVMSVSDSLGIKCGSLTQNVLAESYAIDGGVYLFRTPFTAKDQTLYVLHKNAYAPDGLFSLYTTQNVNTWWYCDLGSVGDAHPFFTGYNGSGSENPALKWGVTGSGRQLLIDALSGSSEEFNSHGEDWAIGEMQPSRVYSETIGAADTSKSGRTEAVLQTEGSVTGETFDGYYSDFTYPSGSFTIQSVINGGSKISLGNVTWSGPLYSSVKADGAGYTYGCPMTIQNLKLKHDAPNGTYKSPIGVKTVYVEMLTLDNVTTCPNHCGINGVPLTDISLQVDARYTDGVNAGVLNDVVIHDPISVMHCQVIGNNYGDYDGAGPAIDDTSEDSRVGITDDEKEKINYGVIGNKIHIWYSDVGDFYNERGSWDTSTTSSNHNRLGISSNKNGCNVYTGVINSSAKGYVDNMNTGLWVKDRLVMFPYPVIGKTVNGKWLTVPANTWAELSVFMANSADSNEYIEVKESHAYGKPISGKTAFHHGSASLEDYVDEGSHKLQDIEYTWGLDYEFFICTSAVERSGAPIQFATVAINDNDGDYTRVESNNVTRATVNGKRNAADSTVVSIKTTDVVGRIGNLALEDTGDFRFSNLFKQATTAWLIPGVIYEVNDECPNNILTVRQDIIGNNRSNAGVSSSHSTLSVTSYLFNTDVGLGKAGKWIELPLTAAKNTVEEFNGQQLRMGYQSYFDIETIGNYYGINMAGGIYNDGEKSIADRGMEDEIVLECPDCGNAVIKIGEDSYKCTSSSCSSTLHSSDLKKYNRKFAMTITPHYYLYDLDEPNTLFNIDMYAGTSGEYTRFYGGADSKNVEYMSESALYIDLPIEKERRNVPDKEVSVTDAILPGLGIGGRAAYTKADYIGTACGIKLDANDLDYIGSPYMYYYNSSGGFVPSGDTYAFNQLNTGMYVDDDVLSSGNLTKMTDFYKQSQRWYFTLGVPSSTFVKNAEVVTAANPLTQQEVLNGHEEFKKAHPNSVIIVLGEITVKGTVWELQYDARHLNGNVPISFKLNGNGNTITLDDALLGTVGADKSWAPLVVWDAWNTSASDLDTYGTH